jgi:hypothetical protein
MNREIEREHRRNRWIAIVMVAIIALLVLPLTVSADDPPFITVTGITPDTGYNTSTYLPVTITGTNFTTCAPVDSIEITPLHGNDINYYNLSVNSETELTADLNIKDSDSYVNLPDGLSSLYVSSNCNGASIADKDAFTIIAEPEPTPTPTTIVPTPTETIPAVIIDPNMLDFVNLSRLLSNLSLIFPGVIALITGIVPLLIMLTAIGLIFSTFGIVAVAAIEAVTGFIGRK